MKVLIGTNNNAKVKKYGTILNDLGIEYCTPRNLNININVEENGKTTEENSKIKAMAYYSKVNMPVLVDDSGLILDNLSDDKQPGVFVRRHNGKVLTDEEIINLYSKEIGEIGGKTKGAFVIAVSIVDNSGKIYTNVVRHERVFVSKPCKERVEGYPMNSLIYNEETNTYLAQNYSGKAIYKDNSFEKDYNFIKSVLKGE